VALAELVESLLRRQLQPGQALLQLGLGGLAQLLDALLLRSSQRAQPVVVLGALPRKRLPTEQLQSVALHDTIGPVGRTSRASASSAAASARRLLASSACRKSLADFCAWRRRRK
jgi:hypothetical protein